MSLSLTIAAPFRHSHRSELKKNEIVYYLAFKQHWMNIEQANQVISRAIEEGLIGIEGDMIRPLFDVSRVEIPLGFKPGASVFQRSDPVDDLVFRISERTGIPKGSVVSEINSIIQDVFQGNLTSEAAAVILAKRHGVEFQDLLPALREQVLTS
ncbi:MAG: DUF2240 family protein [Methanolinea sp.]|jgi:hypothetical protein|nr:DUF2240 family protein [Methanolinea sp.]